MKYAYFPGCSLSSTGIEFDLSTKEVARLLGIELWEIPGWNCCGASSGHLTDHRLALALPARNMAIAEEAGLDVAIPCAACYARSKAVEVAVAGSAKTRQEVEEIIERPYQGKSKARALVDIIANEVSAEAIKEKVRKQLKGLKIACYYGCLLVRPTKMGFDDPEDPRTMDRLMQDLGAETVEWAFKTECCGASHLTTKSDVGLPMLEKIFSAAKQAGADCLVTACPMCMNNLDMRQDQVAKAFHKQYSLPVFYFTELMGLAMGIQPQKLGLDKHFVDAMPLVQKIKTAGSKEEKA
ncbi:CoB--CoM heterodisulfide reductase [Syntrophobotulus glycolicus DSM 8271]|uniref:CoB--CoM heterodisulfide reductase n=1 Tax=Syntrophobotulus glycolicus (strain DSM 8271 / FlGlyR) TaxID=645991 RepID=F0T0Q8_SYNGF|nr:CoB--CoM heterodisulfide reductase iron-sulfur subunit B family protein [Syntrophobotulus glycolicus]ADY56197.1 CoB--CoM heterodisulfide reductase [Syntrophobotulus glycolicus DSM 8271]